MAYPTGVKTRMVSFGGAATVEAGTPLDIRISTVSSRSLIWVAEGYRLESLAASYQSALEGDEILFEVPTTDQSGWLDAETRQAIIVEPGQASHLYTTTLDIYQSGGSKLRTYTVGPYAVPDEPGVLDGDLINPDMDPVSGTLTTFIPGPKGPQGLDGSNVLPTDEAIAQAITTPGSDTQTQLNATIVEQAEDPEAALNATLVQLFGFGSYLTPGLPGLDLWDAVTSPNSYAEWVSYIDMQLDGKATHQVLGEDSYGEDISCYAAGDGGVNVVLISGQHPGEMLGQMGGFAFFKAFALSSHPAMIALRTILTIHWVPTAVPGGYKSIVGDGRTNANGVNVNRDWSVNWVYQAGETGATPFSQPETVLIRDLILDVDARMVFDLHNFGTGTSMPFATGTTDNNFQTKMLTHRAGMANFERANLDHPEVFQYNNPSTNYSSLRNWAGKHLRYDLDHLDAMSVIIECDGGLGGSNNNGLNRTTARWWGSLIHQMILTWLAQGQTDEATPVYSYRGWNNGTGPSTPVEDGGRLLSGATYQYIRMYNTSNPAGNVPHIAVPLRHPGHFEANWTVGLLGNGAPATVLLGIAIAAPGDPIPTSPLTATMKRVTLDGSEQVVVSGTYRHTTILDVPNNNEYRFYLIARCNDVGQSVLLNANAATDMNVKLYPSGLPNYQPFTSTG